MVGMTARRRIEAAAGERRFKDVACRENESFEFIKQS